MYARLVEIENIDPSKREEALQNLRERVIPSLQELNGFAGFISLADAENSRARSVVLWETKEDAEEAERQMKSRREEMVSQLGATVRSADLYEAPIVEVRAGVHA
jgi:quinol monooxygenase YgiN